MAHPVSDLLLIFLTDVFVIFRLKMVYDTYQSLDTFGRQLLNFIFPNVTARPRGRVTALTIK